ncbi:uncharacterized protein F4807DRAFT_458176 [Annulohypoxylon truncatum]|uniref:uncharacterized protein n=1 Tax=Annulohypoxylon truncatum TaxID=327061 RepID=UPI0020087110|nr:uncharacterized protein F4807DRAFT_458176 [Annulohypoxylon truncatum]KAI1211970.1 hypothetical protein F4807DRAFT_458176 [Annulohypoxylon truncatum]
MSSERSISKDIPGISITTAFDFCEALDHIKGKLDERVFTKDWRDWTSSVTDAFTASQPTDVKQNHTVSIIWFSFRFLTVLWTIWFGKGSVPPWKGMYDAMTLRGRNGKDDVLIDVFKLGESIRHKPNNAEQIIRQAIRAYSPLTIRRTRAPA